MLRDVEDLLQGPEIRKVKKHTHRFYLFIGVKSLRLKGIACDKIKERYRSGHNGADSKSAVRLTADRGFESHPLRHF